MYILVQVSDDHHSTDVFDELPPAMKLLKDLKDEAVRDQDCINLTIYECDSSRNLLKQIDYCSVVDGETDYATPLNKDALRQYAAECLNYLENQAMMGVRVTRDGSEAHVKSSIADVFLILAALSDGSVLKDNQFTFDRF